MVAQRPTAQRSAPRAIRSGAEAAARQPVARRFRTEPATADEVSYLVPPVTSAVAEVRRVLKDHCERLGCGDVEDTLILLTSELVANAILHAGGQVKLTLRHDGRRVTVLVDDEGAGMPSLRGRVDGLEERGRGLFLVDALADGWGSEGDEHGKTVWFALSY